MLDGHNGDPQPDVGGEQMMADTLLSTVPASVLPDLEHRVDAGSVIGRVPVATG
jgi:hypothetical protein